MVHSAEDGSIPVPDMSALIARLEAAETGSAELDYLIDEALSEWRNIGGGFAVHKVTGERRRNSFDYTAPVTTSLDAALALAERVLPGCGWSVSMDDRMGWYQSDIGKDHYLFAGEPSRSLARTPALALCIAILKAIQHARSSTAGYEAVGEVSPNLKAKAQGEGG